MAVLDNHQTVGASFGNASEIVVVTYDFAGDSGAIADYDVLTADGEVLVELVNIDVETAATSGGAAVLDLGKGNGGVEYWSDKAFTALTLDAQLKADAVGQFVELADGEKIVLGIEAATLTAGKFHMMFRLYKRP